MAAPLVIAAVAYVRSASIHPAREAVFAGVAILTAFYLYVTTQSSSRLSDLAVAAPAPTGRTKEVLDRHLDLIANGVYGMTVALSALVAGGIATWAHSGEDPIHSADGALSAITIGLLAHLILTMLLVATRSFHAAKRDADSIRSGASARDRESAETTR
ncbi:MAG: hypothetical protein AAFP84_20865 [Actinomycetota bacterium]